MTIYFSNTQVPKTLLETWGLISPWSVNLVSLCKANCLNIPPHVRCKMYIVQFSYPCVAEWLMCSVAKLCLNLCIPMDCSPPGSSVHGVLQTRILEWVAISFSRRSFPPWDWICTSWAFLPALAGRFFTTEAPGKPKWLVLYNNSNNI